MSPLKSFVLLAAILASFAFSGCGPDVDKVIVHELAPEVVNAAPGEVSSSAPTLITITGLNFLPGAAVFVGDFQAENVTVISSTEITAVVNAPSALPGSYDLTVRNPDGQESVLKDAIIFPGPPSVTRIEPYGGPLAGGSNVSLTGSGFKAGAAVVIGGAAALNVQILSGSQLTCTTPPGTEGLAAVTVMNADNLDGTLYDPSAALAVDRGFLYSLPPGNVVCSPGGGKQAGGDTITISADGLYGTATGAFSEPSVTFDGVAASNLEFSNMPVSFTAVNPDNSSSGPGDVSVVVTNPDGQSGSGVFHYNEYPVVGAVTPDYGDVSGGKSVSVTGEFFLPGASVLFDGSAATGVSVVDSWTISCTTPSRFMQGLVDVVVLNPDTQSGMLGGGFTYILGPIVTGVGPSQGSTLGGDTITVSGLNFIDGPSFDVLVDGVSAFNVVWVNNETASCVAPAHAAGTVGVAVINGDGLSNSLASCFTYVPPPDVTGISACGGPINGGNTVSITGTDFLSGAAVSFGSLAAANVVVLDSTTITCTAPDNASAGFADVTVTNPVPGSNNSDTELGVYEYAPAPSVNIDDGAQPIGGDAAGGNTVTINGSGFIDTRVVLGTSFPLRVTFGGVDSASVTWVDANTITCTAPSGSAGNAAVVVTNPDAQSGGWGGAYVYAGAPSVNLDDGVLPVGGPLAGGNSVTINGSGFQSSRTIGATVYPLRVTIGGVDATNVSWISAGIVSCVAPAGSAGNAAVSVINPDTRSADWGDNYIYAPAPSINLDDGVLPIGGPTAGGDSVTITGADFQDSRTIGAGVFPLRVAFGGVAASNVTWVDANTITCTAPSGSAGNAAVVVTNPDAQSGGWGEAYVYAGAPSVNLDDGVLPVGGPLAGGNSVTINGSGFQSSRTIGATVYPLRVTIGGVDATNVTWVGAGVITCVAPAGSAGNAAVSVMNPDTRSADWGDNYIYAPAPSINLDDGVLPIGGPTAGGDSVTITGAYFQDSRTIGVTVYALVVTFGGVAASNVTWVDANTITCTAPSGSAGNAAVLVINADTQSDTWGDSYEYSDVVPLPDGISPTSGVGGDTVTISDSTASNSFKADRAIGSTTYSMRVFFYETNTSKWLEATSVTRVDANTLTCVLPSHAEETGVAIRVMNPDGQYTDWNSPFDFLTPPASITLVSPSVIAETRGGTSTLVTITGTGFQSGASVSFGGASATNVTVVSATQITCNPPVRSVAQGAGQVDVTVTNPSPPSPPTAVNAFTYRKVLTWFLDDQTDFSEESGVGVDYNTSPGNVVLAASLTSGTFTVTAVNGDLLPTATRGERALPDVKIKAASYFHENTGSPGRFLVGGNWGLAYTSDGGTSFKTFTEGTTPSIPDNHVTALDYFSGAKFGAWNDNDTWLVGTETAGAFLTTDGGTSKTTFDTSAPVARNLVDDHVRAVAFWHRAAGSGALRILISAARGSFPGDDLGGVYYSRDGGVSQHPDSPWRDNTMGPMGDSGNVRGVDYLPDAAGDTLIITCQDSNPSAFNVGGRLETINASVSNPTFSWNDVGLGWWRPQADVAYCWQNSLYIICTSDNSAVTARDGASSSTSGLGGPWTTYSAAQIGSYNCTHAAFYNGGYGTPGDRFIFGTGDAGVAFTENGGTSFTGYNTTSTPSLPHNQVNDVEWFSTDNNCDYFLAATEGGVRQATGAQGGVDSFKVFRGGPLTSGRYIVGYDWLEVTETVSSGNDITYQILDSGGTLLPDSVFSAAHQSTYGTNSSGMRPVSGRIDISEIDVNTYHPIQIRVNLSDSGTGTPTLSLVKISFVYANPN